MIQICASEPDMATFSDNLHDKNKNGHRHGSRLSPEDRDYQFFAAISKYACG